MGLQDQRLSGAHKKTTRADVVMFHGKKAWLNYDPVNINKNKYHAGPLVSTVFSENSFCGRRFEVC
jgi:hypothetical protein